MRKLALINITIIGSSSRLLRNVQAGNLKYKDSKGVLSISGIAAFLENFLFNLEQLGFTVTQNYFATFDLKAKLEELKQSANGEVFTAEEAAAFNALCEDVHTVLNAESSSKFSFVTTEKRIDIEKLIEHIDTLFASGIFKMLPPISQYDFTEAGKCIAFERPTAAAFHILRATEDVLKNYYCKKVKRGRSKLLWGDMLASFAKRRKKPPLEITNHLKNIKDDFRNPTAHPEKIYDIEEAQDLLMRCIDVVTRMTRDL